MEESESEISGASAETLPVDHRGRVLPPPPEVPNDELDAFMRTEEGKEYYRQWLAGDQTCRMVRERSGCGLLAKFFQRKVEEDEEQQILQQALLAEAEAKKVNQGANGEGDPDCSTEKPKDENEEKLCGRPRSENDGLQGDHEQIQGEALSQGAEGSSTTVADADGKGQGLHEGRELAQGSRGPHVHHVQPGQEHDQGEEGQELAQGSGGPRAHHVQPGQEHGQGEDPRQELCDEQSALPRAPEHGLSEQGQRTRDEKPSDIAGLVAPATWPSYTLQAGGGIINLESQTDSQTSTGAPNFAMPASSFMNISAEENQRELDFAKAAGDIEEHSEGGSLEVDNDNNQGASAADMESSGGHEAPHVEDDASGPCTTSATDSAGSESSNMGQTQLTLKHWLT